jgi:hypothetical protein
MPRKFIQVSTGSKDCQNALKIIADDAISLEKVLKFRSGSSSLEGRVRRASWTLKIYEHV